MAEADFGPLKNTFKLLTNDANRNSSHVMILNPTMAQLQDKTTLITSGGIFVHIIITLQTKLRKGNVFTPICHTGDWLPSMHHRSDGWRDLHPGGSASKGRGSASRVFCIQGTLQQGGSAYSRCLHPDGGSASRGVSAQINCTRGGVVQTPPTRTRKADCVHPTGNAFLFDRNLSC